MEEEKKEEPDLDKELVINEKYKILYRLGKGGFSKVYLVQNIHDNKKYAMKVLLQKRNSEKNKNNFQKEINLLKDLYKLNNSYILKLYDEGKFISEDQIERLYFIVDYAEKGDLYYYLKINNGLGEKFSKILFKKILEGIQFCHDNNICHFDIKVQNILLDEKFNPIINDFGSSKTIKNTDTNELMEYKGTRGTKRIMCPQMFEEGKTYNGIDADIFALGVLLFYLVIGKSCFKNAIDDSYKNIKDKNYENLWNTITQTDGLSDEFKNLFVRMVAYNPEERPRIKDILLDPWLNELNILIEKNPDEYKKLENEYIDFMGKLEEKINEMLHVEIQAPGDKNGEKKQNTRGISFDESKKYFINLTPKKIKDKRNYKYYIQIKGYINANDFMNLLLNEIKEVYDTNCLLQTDEEELKFKITFINEDDEEENDEEIEEEEDIRKDCIMKVKLYENNNEYLLCFDKCEGDLEEFYENFLKIKNITQGIFTK